MSQITAQDIKKTARLAKIQIDKDLEEQLTKQLGDIIKWFEKLNELNTDNVDILTNVHNINLTLFDDQVLYSNMEEEVLKNAPAAKYNYFTVPKVIE